LSGAWQRKYRGRRPTAEVLVASRVTSFSTPVSRRIQARFYSPPLNQRQPSLLSANRPPISTTNSALSLTMAGTRKKSPHVKPPSSWVIFARSPGKPCAVALLDFKPAQNRHVY